MGAGGRWGGARGFGKRVVSSEREEGLELVVVECGHDEQDAVSSHRSGIDHVAWINGEVLAEHRESDCLAGGHQVLR